MQLCCPGKSLNWNEVNLSRPVICINSAIVEAPKCDTLVIRNQPHAFLLDAIEYMDRLKPVLVLYDEPTTRLRWRNKLIELQKFPSSVQYITWETLSWTFSIELYRKGGINTIFMAMLWCFQHTKTIEIFGCDMIGQGYNRPIEAAPQDWEERWRKERSFMENFLPLAEDNGFTVNFIRHGNRSTRPW